MRKLERLGSKHNRQMNRLLQQEVNIFSLQLNGRKYLKKNQTHSIRHVHNISHKTTVVLIYVTYKLHTQDMGL